ncbi:MAG: CbiX/SirB N-terminal domain-containing protein [Ectothiorhodospiraceae bacterium]|nr:CbiX/SirB N-terminal domain-containing protein [Ectothiorhodospiraceae bacterium]MCH8504360.1 CbiX/SirB N-terminal domain-containing protein [Ectothiorhodospiraceae bacterium]
MRYLLLIAHGSRREASNDEVRALTRALAARAGPAFEGVRCGFLELASPGIGEAVDQCVAAGATEVVVLPYFLSAGRHVVEDIPADLEPKRGQYPQVSIRQLDYVGASDAMLDLLQQLASREPA